MTRLILFQHQDGNQEWVVIDTQDYDDDKLREEYGGEIAEKVELFNDLTSWPTDRALVMEQ